MTEAAEPEAAPLRIAANACRIFDSSSVGLVAL